MVEHREDDIPHDRALSFWTTTARILLYAMPLTIAAVFVALNAFGLLPQSVDPDLMVWLALGSSILGVGAGYMGMRRATQLGKEISERQRRGGA